MKQRMPTNGRLPSTAATTEASRAERTAWGLPKPIGGGPAEASGVGTGSTTSGVSGSSGAPSKGRPQRGQNWASAGAVAPQVQVRFIGDYPSGERGAKPTLVQYFANTSCVSISLSRYGDSSAGAMNRASAFKREMLGSISRGGSHRARRRVAFVTVFAK